MPSGVLSRCRAPDARVFEPDVGLREVGRILWPFPKCVPLAVTEVAERLKIGSVCGMTAIANSAHMVQLEISLQWGVLFLRDVTAATLIVH